MWIGGDFVMLVMVLVLFAGVARSRRPLDGGAWVESARQNSLAGGALAGVASQALDDDEAQLAAYNSYLQTLGGDSGTYSRVRATMRLSRPMIAGFGVVGLVLVAAAIGQFAPTSPKKPSLSIGTALNQAAPVIGDVD